MQLIFTNNSDISEKQGQLQPFFITPCDLIGRLLHSYYTTTNHKVGIF